MPDDDDFATGGADARHEADIANLRRRAFTASFDSDGGCSCLDPIDEGADVVYVDDELYHLDHAIQEQIDGAVTT